MAVDRQPDERPDKLKNRPRNPQREDGASVSDESSDVVDPSGEMESAGKQPRPARRKDEPSTPLIEPDQEPYSKGQSRGA